MLHAMNHTWFSGPCGHPISRWVGDLYTSQKIVTDHSSCKLPHGKSTPSSKISPPLFHSIPIISPFYPHYILFCSFPHGFPMLFPWFSHGFPMGFPWFSHGFPMGFPWVSHGFSPWVFRATCWDSRAPDRVDVR